MYNWDPYSYQYPPGYAMKIYDLILLIRNHTHKYEESEWSMHSPYTSASLLVSTYSTIRCVYGLTIPPFIIQHIITLPKYGHGAVNILRP